MNIAVLRDGSPSGLPVVVSRDLNRCVPASELAGSLDELLREWASLAPALEALSAILEAGRVDAWRFHAAQAMAPVPFDQAMVQAAPGTGGWLAARDPWVVEAPAGAGTAGVERVGLTAGEGGRPVLQVLACRLDDGDEVTRACAPVAVAGYDMSMIAMAGSGLTARLVVGDPAEPRATALVPVPRCGEGAATALALDVGDRFRLAAYDGRGRSVFGAIEAFVEPPPPRMRPLTPTGPSTRPLS